MFAKQIETAIVPAGKDEQYAVVRKCQGGVRYYAADLYGETVYTPYPPQDGKKYPFHYVGMGFTPADNERYPGNPMLIIQPERGQQVDVLQHHWYSQELQ